MTVGEHDHGMLAARALDALTAEEEVALGEHLAQCPDCQREMAELNESVRLLDQLPPEALLDGAPPDGSLLLQRTLRQVRVESRAGRNRRRAILAVAGLALLAIGFVGGAVAFGGPETSGIAADPGPTTSSAQPTIEPATDGVTVASAVDGASGARMTVKVTPAVGWVRVNAAVTGIAEGEVCRLWVVSHDGARSLAGSWLVSEQGAADGTTLDGAAAVAPEDVAAIEVDNTAGEHFVTVPL